MSRVAITQFIFLSFISSFIIFAPSFLRWFAPRHPRSPGPRRRPQRGEPAAPLACGSPEQPPRDLRDRDQRPDETGVGQGRFLALRLRGRPVALEGSGRQSAGEGLELRVVGPQVRATMCFCLASLR